MIKRENIEFHRALSIMISEEMAKQVRMECDRIKKQLAEKVEEQVTSYRSIIEETYNQKLTEAGVDLLIDVIAIDYEKTFKYKENTILVLPLIQLFHRIKTKDVNDVMDKINKWCEDDDNDRKEEILLSYLCDQAHCPLYAIYPATEYCPKYVAVIVNENHSPNLLKPVNHYPNHDESRDWAYEFVQQS